MSQGEDAKVSKRTQASWNHGHDVEENIDFSVRVSDDMTDKCDGLESGRKLVHMHGSLHYPSNHPSNPFSLSKTFPYPLSLTLAYVHSPAPLARSLSSLSPSIIPIHPTMITGGAGLS